MKIKQIIKGNKIIAQFMRITNQHEIYIPVRGEVPVGCELKPYRPEELKYHSSWDWIMHVIGEIESNKKCNGFVTINPRVCFIKNMTSFYSHETQNDCKLTAVYTEVVRFLAWYNNI